MFQLQGAIIRPLI